VAADNTGEGQLGDLEGALGAWRDSLGPENVIVDAAMLRAAETAAFATAQEVSGILRPKDAEQVGMCLKIANQYRSPVYAISSGKNWGYGSSVPVQGGCVILDLARLNEIVDYSEELAYVTLQPGVTQGQLYEYLRQRNSRLWMDATGSSPDYSIIGNTVERGFGHTPHGDRFNHVCGMEVVLPSGEIIHTGFGRFSNAKPAKVYRWGVGPYMDGLFTQSNLGVVTQMTLWLMPAPAYFQAFNIFIERDDQLEEVIDALRPLRLDGTIKSAIHIVNDYKVLSSFQGYPWECAGKDSASLKKDPGKICQELGFRCVEHK
jgi:4-cresol dehydrogenase (hydroxylating)